MNPNQKQQTKKIRIATRSSDLAVWQANQVASLWRNKGIDSTLVKIVSTGDKILDKPLDEIGGKGLFIKELEQALLEGKADIAVHSLKDLPARLPEGFELIGMAGFGASRGDLLMIHPKHANSFVDAKTAFEQIQCVATGSNRRKSFLRHQYPHIETPLLRGNMQTRFRKLSESTRWDGIILAAAAAERLPESRAFTLLEINLATLTPAAGQAIVGMEMTSETKKTLGYNLDFLSEELDSIAGNKERELMRSMGAKCTTPVGCHTYQTDGAWKVNLTLWSENKKFQTLALPLETTWSEIYKLQGCKEVALELGLKPG